MNIYVGYDPKYPEVYKACTNSIFRNTKDASFYRAHQLNQEKLRETGIYTREKDDKASTPFSLTRFLVPALNGYQGWAIYCDSDFIFLDDITHLVALKDDTKAVQVVMHPVYEPKTTQKMDGKQNHSYPMKNWSSLMLFNCEHSACKSLTPQIVNGLPPSSLHQFEWCDDHEVGGLPTSWNHLVGYYPGELIPSALHFTDGGPWLEEYKDVDFAEVWNDYV